MPTIEEARDALQLDQLHLPQDVRVEEVRINEYVDADGDDALFVQVILSEEVDAALIPGGTISDIKDRIRSRLQQIGVRIFCYFSFAKISELNPQ